MTPNQRHDGLDTMILGNIIEQAKEDQPERWNGRDTRNLTPNKIIYLNPGKGQKKPAKDATQVGDTA